MEITKPPSYFNKPDEMRATLADVREGFRVGNALIVAMAQELWGAPCDWEGRNTLDVRQAVGHLDRPGVDSVAIAAAIRLTNYHLKGTGWSWLLRQLRDDEKAPYRYVANITREHPGVHRMATACEGGRLHTHSYAMLPHNAMMMSLVLAVHIERDLQTQQRARHGTQSH